MKKSIWIVCAVVFMFAVSFTAVMAEEKAAPATTAAPAAPAKTEAAATPAPDAKDKAEYAKKVGLFYQVVHYGEAQKDPLVLLGAIRLLDDLPFQGIAKPGQDEKTARYDRASLIAEAKKLAAGDEELLAVIAKVETPPEKTAVRHGGPGYHHGYYNRHHHRRHYGCVWFQVCRHGYCNWVCR